jgi:cell wall-associated NlpC family hydrolase
MKYAFKFVGQPYKWGGDDPLDGFDCSGLVQEILAAVGCNPIGDLSSQQLYDWFQKNGTVLTVPKAGALVFFGTGPTGISHIALALDDKFMLEAGGGGRECTTRAIAAQKNAYTRIRPIARRKDLVGICLPKYPFPIP